jgi:pilus assembly protein Flp/PilA
MSMLSAQATEWEAQGDLMAQWTVIAAWARARFGNSERGATLVEYALLVALIAVACIVAVSFLSGKAKSNFSNVGNSIGGGS